MIVCPMPAPRSVIRLLLGLSVEVQVVSVQTGSTTSSSLTAALTCVFTSAYEQLAAFRMAASTVSTAAPNTSSSRARAILTLDPPRSEESAADDARRGASAAARLRARMGDLRRSGYGHVDPACRSRLRRAVTE